jgi:hypothetical protein
MRYVLERRGADKITYLLASKYTNKHDCFETHIDNTATNNAQFDVEPEHHSRMLGERARG